MWLGKAWRQRHLGKEENPKAKEKGEKNSGLDSEAAKYSLNRLCFKILPVSIPSTSIIILNFLLVCASIYSAVKWDSNAYISIMRIKKVYVGKALRTVPTV